MKLTQGEINALEILTATVKSTNDVIKNQIEARNALIKLLEFKYNLTFSEQEGFKDVPK